MPESISTVHVVDDDVALLESLRFLIETDGLHVVTYTSAKDFMQKYSPKNSGCLLLDIRMPNQSGLELQERLSSEQIAIPIIFISGHADVPIAVRAMKSGAFDFFTKPFSELALLESIHKALYKDLADRQQNYKVKEIEQCIQRLTPREKEIMMLIVKGRLNKVISSELGIGMKTVEIHRARIMQKMQAKSLAQLVTMVVAYDNTHAH